MQMLRKEWPHPDFAFIQEFRGGTGWSRQSSADAIAMDLWPSRGLKLVGFEVKTSRADWLKELKQPEKCEPIKQFCDKWYLVVDDTKIVKRFQDEEVPDDWGYMCVSYSSWPPKLEIKKDAPQLKPNPIDKLFLASLMRLASDPFNEVNINGRNYIAKI